MDANTLKGDALFDLLKQNLRDWQTDRKAYGKKQTETARQLMRERKAQRGEVKR